MTIDFYFVHAKAKPFKLHTYKNSRAYMLKLKKPHPLWIHNLTNHVLRRQLGR